MCVCFSSLRITFHSSDSTRELGLAWSVTRVNSTNVQDEGLRIGGIERQMNSKVKVSQTRHVSRINVVVNLA
jgi:hypothetical protein